MNQTQLTDACGTLQNLGCVFIGTTKIFSGRMTNTVGDVVTGYDLRNHKLSMVITLNERVVIENAIVFKNTTEASEGYWELKAHMLETIKLQPDTEYVVEFALFDLQNDIEEMDILGRGILLAKKALHHV